MLAYYIYIYIYIIHGSYGLYYVECRLSLATCCWSKEGYSQLASLAHSEGRKLFRLRPKLHMLFEIALQLEPPRENGNVLSPIATCCWSDEDYIGRVSRAARSCHGATQSIGAMRKTLGVYRLQFTRNAAKQRSGMARMEKELHQELHVSVGVNCSLGKGLKRWNCLYLLESWNHLKILGEGFSRYIYMYSSYLLMTS